MTDDRDASGRYINGHTKMGGRPKTVVIKNISGNGNPFAHRDNHGRYIKGGGSGHLGRGDKFYIIWCEGDYYKIGICIDARSRMAMLQANMPYKAELMY